MTDAGFEAAAVLAKAQAARERLAAKLACPPWMHAVFGSLYAALVGAVAGPDGLMLCVDGAVMLAVPVLIVLNRRRMGFFVNGYRRGRTRPIALGLVGAYLACFSLAFWLRTEHGLRWPALVLAMVMFGVGTAASWAWVRTYRSELGAAL